MSETGIAPRQAGPGPRKRQLPRLRSPRSICLALVCLGVVGCSTLEKQPERAAVFSDAGTAYLASVGPLIDSYYASRVDSNSLDLITAAAFSAEDATLRQQLASNDSELVKGYKVLSDIKQHNALLEQYFRALGAFARDESATGIKEELDSLVKGLKGLGLRTETLTIFDKSVDTTKVASLVVDVGVGIYKNVELREHLKNHGQDIERELAVQKALIDFIAEDMNANFQNVYRRTVTKALSDEFVKNKDKTGKSWRERRIAHITRVATVDDALKNAQATAADMRLKWKEFAEGKLLPGSLAELKELALELARSVQEIRGIFFPTDEQPAAAPSS